MKIVWLTLVSSVMCSSAMADIYNDKKNQIRQKLIKCVNDPLNFNSASFNQCILDGAQQFKTAADSQMQKRIQQETMPEIRQGWIKDSVIHTNAIKQCQVHENLNFQGFTYAAQCELKRSQDYYRYSMSNNMEYPSKWTMANRIDALYLSF